MISLILATYNGEKYITDQLESIRNQTLQPDEVIICDDRSTDNTYNVVCEYMKKNNLTWKVLVNKLNYGYSKNFCNLLELAKGDIIFLSDQDDIWYHNKIEKMMKVMDENPNISLLASDVEPFYEGDNPQEVNFEKFNKNRRIIKINNKYKWIKPIRPGCSMCFRISRLKEFKDIWYEEYPHDCLLWGISVLNGGAYLLNEPTIKFRRHDNNASSRGGRSVENRIKTISREVDIISKMLNYQKIVRNKLNIEMLEKQLNFYLKRKAGLERRKLFAILLLLPQINYYGRLRFWLTDIYYCIK